MSNPKRYRIIDLTGTCFSHYLGRPHGNLKRSLRKVLFDSMKSVRPFTFATATYACRCLTDAGFIQDVDFELVQMS